MMHATIGYPDTYREARHLFLEACQGVGCELQTYRNPRTGPHGWPLYVDLARIGAPQSDAAVLVISGTHGVEGFCGSTCQSAWLAGEGLVRLRPDRTVYLLHAVNPFGFAWIRRVNEDNVDVNRNFVDFTCLPENARYRELAASLAPPLWDDVGLRISRTQWRTFIEQYGEDAFVAAVAAGQYEDADGLFYGGSAPVWSHDIFHQIASEQLIAHKRLAIIDVHSGLGPFGHGEVICRHPPDSPAMARAQSWYGDAVTSPQKGDSVSAYVSGNLRMAPERWLAEVELTAVSIEFGTYDSARVLSALIADNWLHLHGDLTSAKGQAIKAEMREVFFPTDTGWRAAGQFLGPRCSR